MQRVERVEELFEGRFLAAEELDVVDEQHVDLAVSAVEFCDAVLALGRGLQCLDEFVGEFLAVDVSNLERGILDQCIVADGVEQVGLAQSRSAVDTQRVEFLPGSLGDRKRDSACETVGITGNERVERRVLVQMGFRIAHHLLLPDRKTRLAGYSRSRGAWLLIRLRHFHGNRIDGGD